MKRQYTLIAVATLLLQSASILAQESQKCYYPNGEEAIDYSYVSCNNSTSSTDFSACCYPDEGDICTASGLCNWPDNYYYRGACTDPTWEDENCPQQICKEVNSDTWIALTECPHDNGWCCATSETDCCTDGSEIFELDPDTVLANLASSSLHTPLSSSTSETDNEDQEEEGTSVTAAAAAGAGGAVFFIAVASLAFFLIRRRRAKKTSLKAGKIPLGDRPEPSAASGMFMKPPSTSGSEMPGPMGPWPLSNQQQQQMATVPPGSPPPAYQPGATMAAAGGSPAPMTPDGPWYPPPAGNAVESDSMPVDPRVGVANRPAVGQELDGMTKYGPASVVSPARNGEPTPTSVSPNGAWYPPPVGNAVECDSRPVEPRYTRPTHAYEMPG